MSKEKSCDHIDDVVCSQEHKEDPLIDEHESCDTAKHGIALQEELNHVHGTGADMATVVEVVGVMVWNCQGRHPWVKPCEAFWSSHQEGVLNECSQRHEDSKGKDNSKACDFEEEDE